MNNRRRLFPFMILLCFGVASLFNMLSSGRLEMVRAVDVVQLIGTGMCFGAAIVTLVFFFRGPRSG